MQRPIESGVLIVGVLALATAAPARAQSCGLNETAELTASDAANLDFFGSSVDIDGDFAIVGSRKDDTAAPDAGSAYVFQRGPGGWSEVTELTASDAAASDLLGTAVAISGEYAFAGAFADDDDGNSSGAVYVFKRDLGGPNNWGQLTKLTASDAAASAEFGRHLAAGGDTLLVTAQGDAEFGGSSGALYVFRRDLGGLDQWGEVVKVTASDAQPAAFFGIDVGIDGDTAIVGAFGHDDGANNTGAAYVFRRNQGGPENWGQVAKLTASDPETDDSFGRSVAVQGNTAIVSAHFEDTAGSNAGAVYFFERNLGGPDSWGETAKQLAPDGAANDQLGTSVAIWGNVALAASIQTDGGGASAGSAYMFQRDLGGSNAWGSSGVLTASDASGGENYGEQVAMSGDDAIAGAPWDGHAGPIGGSAYVSSVGTAAEVVRLGSPPNPNALLPGLTSGPVIGSTWDPVIDHTAFLPGAAIDMLGLSVLPANLVLPGLGTLLCDPANIITLFAAPGPGQPFLVALPNDCGLVGVSLVSQGVSSDGIVIRLTNALDLTLGGF